MDQNEKKQPQPQPRTDYTWNDDDKRLFLEVLEKLDKGAKK